MSEVVVGETRMLIDGELVEARSGNRFPNIDPATEDVLGQAADAGLEDMEVAIAAARRAFDQTDWATNHTFRRRCLEQLSSAIADAAEDFRRIDVAELGRPITLSGASVKGSLPRFAEMAALAENV